MEQIKFKKIALNISFKQYEKFKQLAQEDGLPYSELIRRALDEYVERRCGERGSWAGGFDQINCNATDKPTR